MKYRINKDKLSIKQQKIDRQTGKQIQTNKQITIKERRIRKEGDIIKEKFFANTT